MSKDLITYFSCSGNTENVAKKINDIVNGEIAEIKPAKAYTAEDLNWHDSSTRATVEMHDDNACPEIESDIAIDGYDNVFIGFPIWWGEAPRIINTFIENTDLKDKKVILFCTSGSSPMEPAEQALKASYPDLDIISAKRIANGEDIKSWIEDIEQVDYYQLIFNFISNYNGILPIW